MYSLITNNSQITLLPGQIRVRENETYRFTSDLWDNAIHLCIVELPLSSSSLCYWSLRIILCVLLESQSWKECLVVKKSIFFVVPLHPASLGSYFSYSSFREWERNVVRRMKATTIQVFSSAVPAAAQWHKQAIFNSPVLAIPQCDKFSTKTSGTSFSSRVPFAPPSFLAAMFSEYSRITSTFSPSFRLMIEESTIMLSADCSS